jgi:TatA/E family protein of Tat protein translocase
MGPLGWQETIFIFVLALLIFGPKKLPELGRTIGKAMTEFRRASSELRSSFDREMRTLERETESINREVAESTSDTYNYDYDNSSYDSGYYDSGSATDSSATETATASASATEGAESQPAAATESTDPVLADNNYAEQPYGTIAQGNLEEQTANGIPAAEQKA